MSEHVSTFLDVQLGKQKCLFFLVTWSDYVTKVSDEIDKQWDHFGADLGRVGTVIRAYKQHEKASFEEVAAKAWPKEIKERIGVEQDPFILVIEQDFEIFDPRENRWGIIWCSNFREESGTIYLLFGSLARRVRNDGDVFGYIESVARKGKFAKLLKYFQIKPGVFGIAVDIKAILEDLAKVE